MYDEEPEFSTMGLGESTKHSLLLYEKFALVLNKS